MSYPHVNAIRDTFFESQTVKCFAFAAASWVDHETDILESTWARLAEPIRRNRDGSPPRATAARFMAELERLGIFRSIKRAGKGRGHKSQWLFTLQCTKTNGEYKQQSATKCPPKDGHFSQTENAHKGPQNAHKGPQNAHSANAHETASHLTATGQSTAPNGADGRPGDSGDIGEKRPDNLLKESETPKSNCTKPNDESASKKAVDEMLRLLTGSKRMP